MQQRRRLALMALLLALLIVGTPVSAQSQQTVTLLHFSDYHSHALPLYSEGQEGMAGIARLIAYLKPHAADANTLIFSGGDSMNKGTPAWSDKYRCAEWPWFNGLLDAMAYGNHDADYGPAVLADCRDQIEYPILGANVLDAAGAPVFQHEGKEYALFDVNGVKVGVFALAGSDFKNLLRPETSPVEGVTFADRVETARRIVQTLRDTEGANAVVLIGHALYEDDLALAQAVPGIDLIFGTHSHREEGLTKIPNSNTWIISPFQYATYLSKVTLTVEDGKVTKVDGGLVEMSNTLPEEPEIVEQVAEMQAALEADPQYAALYEPIGSTRVELSTEGQIAGESVLGNFFMDIFRSAAQSHVALSTASSFREPIAPGEILEEEFRAAVPYKNKVLVYDMTGSQLEAVLNHSISRSGTDFFAQLAGVRFNIVDGKATNIQVLKEPLDAAAGYEPLDPAKQYKVATTNYMGQVAGGYKELFANAPFTELPIEDIRDEVRHYIQSNSPVSAQLDQRIALGAASGAASPPQALPPSGGTSTLWLVSSVLGLGLVMLGLLLRGRVPQR